jgi:hypothetical protein
MKVRERLDHAIGFVRRRPIAVGSALVLIILFFQVMLRPRSEWDLLYVPAGQALWSGQEIPGGYTYPPFMAMLSVPFGFMPTWLSRLLYFLLSALGMVVLVRAAWSLAGGAPFDGRPWPRREWYAFGFGLVCGGPYILNTFGAQQTDVLIGALLLWGGVQLLRGRDGQAGAFIGVAAACKATPLLFFPYLLWKRRWLAGLLLVVVAVSVNLLPNLVSARADGDLWLGRWVGRILIQRYEAESALGAVDVRLKQELNRSLGGTAYRVAKTRLEYDAGRLRSVDRAWVSTRTVIVIAGAILAVMGILSLAAMYRAYTMTGPPRGDLPDPLAHELGIVLMLMLLMSPVSSSPHFNTLILPGFCLARLALATGDRWIWAPLLSAAALTAISNKDLVGESIYTVLAWLGTTTLATMLLWLGCVIALLRMRPAADGAHPHAPRRADPSVSRA